MSKRNIITVLGIIAAGLMFLCMLVYLSRDDKNPTINFLKAEMVYTDTTDTQELLSAVSAADEKDGDVSSTLRVLFVIPNQDNSKVTVVYAAKDRSNNVAKAMRTYDYSGNKKLIELDEPDLSETQNTAKEQE